MGGTGVAKKGAESDPSQEFSVDLIDPPPHPPKKTYNFPKRNEGEGQFLQCQDFENPWTSHPSLERCGCDFHDKLHAAVVPCVFAICIYVCV